MSEGEKPRRSWMVVPGHDAAAVMRYPEHEPDVVVVDLEYSVPPKAKQAARDGLGERVAMIADGQATVFVRVERETRWVDVRAAMHRGIRGIVLPGPESSAEVADLDALMTEMEKARGIETGTTELALILESAQGFWDAAAIAGASRRVSALGIGRIDLTMMLGPVPQGEFRIYRFLMSRTVVAARMLGKQPLGAHWRPGSRGGVADQEHTARAAREARLMGFSGCLCATPDQVAPVNQEFTLS